MFPQVTALPYYPQVTRVITPTVAREARAQFNCSSLDGAQLEDQGGSGSVNSHWWVGGMLEGGGWHEGYPHS